MKVAEKIAKVLHNLIVELEASEKHQGDTWDELEQSDKDTMIRAAFKFLGVKNKILDLLNEYDSEDYKGCP